MKGGDLRYNMTIDLEDAYKGKTVEVRIPVSETCDECHGSGAKKGTQPKTCATCNGIGQVQYRQGPFSINRTCPECHGAGKVVTDPCPKCRGAGRVEKNKSISINIPRGVDNDTRVRLSGEGDAGVNGGPHGDLYIFVTVRKHDLFKRGGNDLFMEVPVTFADAALGTKIEVPTLDGQRTTVEIPEGTQPGDQVRLRGKGMPVVNSSAHGDLYVEVAVEVPTKLSKEQRKLLEEFRKASGGKNHPAHDSFFKKLGRFFEG
jgi:molecular chaperone DnaJ